MICIRTFCSGMPAAIIRAGFHDSSVSMIRLGIVDFDSSHSVEFTRRFNHVGIDPGQTVEGARVVLGWPGTSEMSPERIAGFTTQLRECGVTLVDEPTEMIGEIDAVLVLSLCGGVHLERVRPFLEAGLPAYVDKPFTCSIDDAEQIVQLAEANDTFVYGTSAMRFSDEVIQFQERETDFGRLNGVLTYGPAKRAEGNPGLFHYGIHAVELLFTLMGTGVESVTATCCDGADVVTGRWRDGRVAGLRGTRTGATAYGFLAFCERGVIDQRVSTRYAYRNLCRSIVETFQSRQAAVANEVTLEVVRFVLATMESERRNGEPVAMENH